jgi:hypothetical protein
LKRWILFYKVTKISGIGFEYAISRPRSNIIIQHSYRFIERLTEKQVHKGGRKVINPLLLMVGLKSVYFAIKAR